MSNPNLDKYWRTVMETMMDALMVVDNDGLIVAVNKAMTDISGFDREELIGRPCSVLNCDSCKGVQNVASSRHCALFHRGSVSKLRCAVRRKDGRLVPVLKNAKVLRTDTGQVIGGVETLADLTEATAQEEVIRNLTKELGLAQGFEGIIGQSPIMKRLFDLIRIAAETQASVLIQGPSGTGKELVAGAIHRLGDRADGPFIKVNCAALNQSLLESELFGHVKGAFTGAERDRLGRFEAADGGDLFLDEIGDLPLETQVKLLRVLQEKEIERVGSNQTIPIDVRFICATNRNLTDLIDQGLFRSDLYYRINVLPISVPALKDRIEDIPLLVDTFVNRLSALNPGPAPGVDPEAMELLRSHDWPGNVRELINAVEYALASCRSGVVRPEHLPPPVIGAKAGAGRSVTRPGSPADRRRQALAAVDQSGGNKTRAAERLGISRVTLWRWLNGKSP